jgi:5-methylcytosine-specific restriction endonuclease McrA
MSCTAKELEYRRRYYQKNRALELEKNKAYQKKDKKHCQYVKAHLEAQFKEGMSWENWGVSGWHVDHIIPLSSFDLSDEKQLKKAVHYSNLQPLWAADNIIKSCK